MLAALSELPRSLHPAWQRPRAATGLQLTLVLPHTNITKVSRNVCSAVWRSQLLMLARRGVEVKQQHHKTVFTSDFNRSSLFSVPLFLSWCVKYGSESVSLWELQGGAQETWTLDVQWN